MATPARSQRHQQSLPSDGQHGRRSAKRGRTADRVDMSAPAPRIRGPPRRRGHQHHRGTRETPHVTQPSQTIPSNEVIINVPCDINSDVVVIDDDVSCERIKNASDDFNRNVVTDDSDVIRRIAGVGEEEPIGERPAAEGAEEDAEAEELARLRCTSECTEVLAERENRRRRRCADYPGLAFGSSIFSSDTMMKFSIIKNELQNIKNTALKRAESEVAALNRRIQLLEEDLERSEERLATATAKLSEASQAADESERIRKALENRTNMEDDRVAILEAQLSQAKLIAEESDKKYEEVARKLVMMEQDLERAEERSEQSDCKIVELEEELRVVGNNLKSLEVSEEKATQREENFEGKVKVLDGQLKQAEARAEFAERSVQKLQKEVDRLEDDLVTEREKNKLLQEEMEATLHDIQNM